MSPLFDRARWARIDPLLDELLELSPDERGARLASIAADDAELARELESLLDDGARAAQANFLEPASDSLAGTRLGAYLLEAPLGSGGHGTVWRARRADGRYEGSVAVKLLHLSLVGRSGAVRFEREGAILARLSHPNIARLLDAGVAPGGQPYLVLELVEGERIDLHCNAEKLGLDARVALFEHVLDAVAHAHRHLVVHRDLKPANILVTTDGTVKLLDFGIAKLLEDEAGAAHATALTRDGGRALTPWYAAPEQLRDEPVTTATDVYALGVVLYELLAGQHPTHMTAPTMADAIRATLEREPPTMSQSLGDAPAAAVPARAWRGRLRGDLDNIVAKALRKAPSERYPSVDAFVADLQAWSSGRPVSARPRSFAYVASRFVARHRVGVGAGALVALAVVAGVIGTVWEARRADEQRVLAEQAADLARHERDGALAQQRLLRGNNEFLQLLMRDTAQGEQGGLRRQLERARVLIGRTSFEHPIVKVALLRQTAARFAELGDFDASLELLREAQAAMVGTELIDPKSGVPVNLACSLAQLRQVRGEYREALASLDRADALLAAGAEVSAPSRIECKTVRARVETASGHYERGLALARESLADLDAAGIRGGEQRRVVRSVLSQALMAQGRHAEAMAEAMPLLRESEAGQGRRSMAVLSRSNVVTSLTRLGGDPLAALARSEADRADLAAVAGAAPEGAPEFDLEHARTLLALGRALDALPAFARAAEASTHMGDTPNRLAAQLGEVEALAVGGRVDDAQAAFDRLADARRAAEASGTPEGIEALRVGAVVAAARGRIDEARHALAVAMERIDAAGGLPWSAAASVSRLRAELELGHDPPVVSAAAERALREARRCAIDPERSADVGRAWLVAAHIAAARGDAAVAHADAASAVRALEPTLGAVHPRVREARVLESLDVPVRADGARRRDAPQPNT